MAEENKFTELKSTLIKAKALGADDAVKVDNKRYAQGRAYATGRRKNAVARVWVKLGFISFGGPAGQIAIMHRELGERRRWLSEDRFLHALNYCMLLPGPEAQQLATYIGWLMHRTLGGIVAGACFVIPSIFILLGLSRLYGIRPRRGSGRRSDGLQACGCGDRR